MSHGAGRLLARGAGLAPPQLRLVASQDVGVPTARRWPRGGSRRRLRRRPSTARHCPASGVASRRRPVYSRRLKPVRVTVCFLRMVRGVHAACERRERVVAPTAKTPEHFPVGGVYVKCHEAVPSKNDAPGPGRLASTMREVSGSIPEYPLINVSKFTTQLGYWSSGMIHRTFSSE